MLDSLVLPSLSSHLANDRELRRGNKSTYNSAHNEKLHWGKEILTCNSAEKEVMDKIKLNLKVNFFKITSDLLLLEITRSLKRSCSVCCHPVVYNLSNLYPTILFPSLLSWTTCQHCIWLPIFHIIFKLPLYNATLNAIVK